MDSTTDSSNADRPWGQSRFLWVLFLLVVAVFYYGSYYRHGINFRDEGGTVTLLAKRVYAGEVPFKDVVLGYNVGWFLPIASLFEVTGVSFVVVRIYFFALSTLAAVLAYLTVDRVGRHAGLRWSATIIGVLVALLLIAIPGMTFKNYNPLAVVANAWALVNFVLATTSRQALVRASVGGLILGGTWLVRIDLGTFFTVLWLGVLAMRMFERSWNGRAAALGGSFLLVVAGVGLMHAPVLWDAQDRGYLAQFLKAYPSQWEKLAGDLRKVSGGAKKTEAPVPVAAKPAAPVTAQPAAAADPANPAPATDGAVGAGPVAAKTPAPPVATPVKAVNSDTLARVSWNAVSAAKGDKREDLLGLFLLTYLPLLSIVPLVLWSAVRWGLAVARGRDSRTPLAALVLLGSALTLFAQFFFWRPDAPHLSEFGPGFWLGAVGATLLLGGWGRSWAAPSRWMLIYLVLLLGVWVWRMGPDRWCGTIAARGSRKTWLDADNGVEIYEQQRTVDWVTEVRAQIRERTSEHDYLVAYPYHPAFNLIVNRPTYEKNLYVDNATSGARWSQDAIERIERFKPKVVIISGWSVNGHPSSRFKNWAPKVYAHVASRYENFGSFGDKRKDGTLAEEDAYEVFIRRPDAQISIKP